MRCSGCGRETTTGDTFCPECGIRVAGGKPTGPVAGSGRVDQGAPDNSMAGSVPPSGAAGSPGEPDAPAPILPPVPLTPGSVVEASVGPGPIIPPVTMTPGLEVDPAPILPPVGYPPATPGPATRKTSALAVASLVLGITCFFLVPIIGALLAIVFGAVARSSIKRSKGDLGGRGMATAGLTLGIIGLVLPLIIAAVAVPVGLAVWWPKVEARRDLLKGVDAARAFYYQNDSSYSGMTAARLAEIDGTVEFSDAPGSEPDLVYIRNARGRSAELVCYSRRDDRYTASAVEAAWKYSFRITEPERHRWWEDWDEVNPF